MEKQAPKRSFGSSSSSNSSGSSEPQSPPFSSSQFNNGYGRNEGYEGYEGNNQYDGYEDYTADDDVDANFDRRATPNPANRVGGPLQWLPDDAIEYLPNNRALTVRPSYPLAICSRTRLSARATLGLIALFVCVLGGGFLLRSALMGNDFVPTLTVAAASPAYAAAASLPMTPAPASAVAVPVGPVVVAADGVKIALPMPPTATPPARVAVGLPKVAATIVAGDNTTNGSAAAARVAGGLQPIYAPNIAFSDGLPTYICAGQNNASFATLIQMQMSGRDVAHGFHLGLVPFGLSTETGFDSVARAQADNALRRGDWDCELTSVDQVARVGHAVITALTDSSAGADGIWGRPVSTTNPIGVLALRGKRVGYVRQSPAEYFLRYSLAISQINPETGLTLLPFDTVAESVNAFSAGEVDAVAAWQPGVAPLVAAGARPILTTERFRTVTHVIATSRYAIESKLDLVQAFHDAWFETLKAQVENVPVAASQIAAWGNSPWLGIRNTRAADDTRAILLRVAQADLSDNTRVMSRSVDLLTQIAAAQTVWQSAGQSVALGAPAALMDARFVLRTAQQDALVTLRPPVNDSYTSHLPAAPLPGFVATAPTPIAVQAVAPVATPLAVPSSGQTTLPCRRFDFLPDSAILTDASRELLDRCVLPALRQNPNARLHLTGSAAWPGPAGTYTEDQIRSLAHARAQAIADYVASQQIDSKRLSVDAVVPPTERREVDDIVLQSQDRYVEMTLIPAAK